MAFAAQLLDGEECLLPKKGMLGCQRAANGGTKPAEMAFGGAIRGEDGLWSVNCGGRWVLWIRRAVVRCTSGC